MQHNYLEFADLFSRLSPYELDHLSGVLLCKLESGVEGRYIGPQKVLLSEKEIKIALIDAMRDIAIVTRERKLSFANMELHNAKALMFTTFPIKAA